MFRRELDLLPDPAEAYRRRGAHWTFDGRRFLGEVADARRTGRGSFPGFDHARGDPVENQWKVRGGCARNRCVTGVVVVEARQVREPAQGVRWQGGTAQRVEIRFFMNPWIFFGARASVICRAIRGSLGVGRHGLVLGSLSPQEVQVCNLWLLLFF